MRLGGLHSTLFFFVQPITGIILYSCSCPQFKSSPHTRVGFSSVEKRSMIIFSTSDTSSTYMRAHTHIQIIAFDEPDCL